MSGSRDRDLDTSGVHFQFMKAELGLCFTFTDVAETSYRLGNAESGDSALKKAGRGYKTLHQSLEDPRHSRRLTKEEMQLIIHEMQRLLKALDALHHR